MALTTFPQSTLHLGLTVTSGTLNKAAIFGDGKLVNPTNTNKVNHTTELPNFGSVSSTSGNQIAGEVYETYTGGPAALAETAFSFLRDTDDDHQKAIRALIPGQSMIDIGVYVKESSTKGYVDYAACLFLGFDDTFPTGSDGTMTTVSIQPQKVKMEIDVGA